MKKWTKRSSIILLSFIVISASLCWLMTPGLGFSSLEITEFYSSSHDLEDGKYKIRPNEEITLYYSLNIWETGQSGFINWGDGNVVLLNEFDVFAYIKHSYSIEGYYEVTLWVLNPYYNDSSTLAIEVINDPPEFDIGVSYDLATYNFEDNSPNTSGKSIELFSDSGDIATSELPYKVEIIYDENVEGNVLSYSDYNIPSYPQTRDYFKKNPQWFGHDGKITYGYIYWFFKTSNPTSNTIFKVDNAIQFGVIDNYVQYYNFETSSYEVSNVIIEKDTWYFFKLYFGSSFYGVYMNGKPCYVNGGYGLPISNKEFFEYFEIIGDNENYESCNFYIDGLDYSWDPNSYSDYFEHHNEYWNDYFKKPDVFYMNSLIALNPKDLIEYSYDKQHLSYVWNTGDGQTCDDRIVRHSWGAKGTYKITLTIIDPFGALTTQDREITIVDPNSPEVVAGFDADFKYGIDPYATYNFKYDLVDSNPYYFNCSEDFDNSISIVSDLENHYKVCKIVGNLVPNDHGNYINNSFEEKNNGTIEWWASTNYISFNTAWDTKFSFYSRYDEFVGMIYYKNGDAYWYEGSTSTLLKQDLSKSGWNFWSVFWIENSVEIKLNNKEHWNVALKSLEDSINCFSINVYNSSQTLFIDGIGYSWDPNYILGESGALFSRTYKASYSFQFFPDGSIQDDYNDYSHAWGFFTNNEGELGDDCNAIIVPESEEHTKCLSFEITTQKTSQLQYY